MRIFNVKLLYAYKFMGQCLPIYAFYTILFIERGMSVANVAALIALWSVFTIVFEVPSGAMADRWNRRNMLAMAAVLQGLCFIIWFFAHTFLLFAVGFAFWAVAAAFISGTEEGLVYDNLKSDGCPERFTRVYGKARFYGNAGTLIGIALAGIIVNYISIGTIVLISAVICFINAIFALQIREKNYYSERVAEEESLGIFETFRETCVFVKARKVALMVILFLVFLGSLGEYLNEFDALIINDFGLSNTWVSVILTVRYVFVALGDILAPAVQKKADSVRKIFLADGIACVMLLIFSILWSRYAILIFGMAFMVMSITEILLINTLQNEIKEQGRATVMSFYGVGQNVVMIGFSLIYALLAGVFTLQQVYIMISAYGIVGGLGFYLVVKRRKNRF